MQKTNCRKPRLGTEANANSVHLKHTSNSRMRPLWQKTKFLCRLPARLLAWWSILVILGPLGGRAVVLQEVAALGDNQLGELVLGLDGNFYGLTQRGGTADKGTVFRATPEGVIRTLVSFTGANGAVPLRSLIRGADGDFYGTTSRGGANDLGTVFRMSPDGTLTTLTSFSGPNGALPCAALCQGHDGLLYGTTRKGGTSNWGCVFQVSTSGELAVLASFAVDSWPSALVQADNGFLYGTTSIAGSNDAGSVFRISTNGEFRTLFSFLGGFQGNTPQGGLIVGQDGNLFGTTTWGGNSDTIWGHGTLFRITLTGALSTLARFNQINGERPIAKLVRTKDGTLYGTMSLGGAYGLGSIFKLTTSGQFSSVVSFDGTNGALPYGGLTVGNDGNLYGMTSGGGEGGGTFFRMSPEGTLATLAQFQSLGFVGNASESPLLMARDGNLYGLTSFCGGYGRGTIFKIDPQGRISALASFSTADGFKAVNSRLTEATDGYLYGTTAMGGSSGKGTIFRVSLRGELKTLFSFQGANGATPLGGLVQATDGYLYGTTRDGGINDDGTVFRFNTNGALTTLFRFSGGNGSSPAAALIQARDGDLYGSTLLGGNYQKGTIFRLTMTGALNVLVHFDGKNGDDPEGGPLLEAADGYLYGTTCQGGSYGKGTVFRVTTNGILKTLASFSGLNGRTPLLSLVQSADGYLYGATYRGGANDCGTVYRISTNGVLTTLVSFDGINGAGFLGLALLPNGTFYGATGDGGPRLGGTVFRMILHSITGLQFVSDHAVLNCSGVPFSSYDIQTATNLAAPVWETITTCSADTNGLIQFNHASGANAAARFYRLAPK
jgi:uncharacterized repeat protein (TIGR03803 family)